MASKKKTLLIVDDEPEIIEFLSSEFKAAYHVLTATNGQECIDLAQSDEPNLILLDITMPILGGLEALQQLKADHRTSMIPVLILSAHSEIDVLLNAFKLGVEDYIEKPFRLPELKARVDSKISRQPILRPAKLVKLGNLKLDPAAFDVAVAGQHVKVSRTEYRLIQFLVERAGRVVTRAEILNSVWAKDSVSERTVDIYLVKVRKKLESFDHEIAMLYGEGYVLRPRAA